MGPSACNILAQPEPPWRNHRCSISPTAITLSHTQNDDGPGEETEHENLCSRFRICWDECIFFVLRSFRVTHMLAVSAARRLACIAALIGRLRPGAASMHASLCAVAVAERGATSGVPQVIELATQGAAAVAVWMKQQLLEHVQKLAVCRDVAT